MLNSGFFSVEKCLMMPTIERTKPPTAPNIICVVIDIKEVYFCD